MLTLPTPDRSRGRSRCLAIALALILVPALSPAQPPLTLERIYSDPPLQGRLPRQAELSPGGTWVGFLQPSARDSERLELWVQPAVGGAPVRLVSGDDLLAGASQALSEAEKMALQRRRIDESGITAWQWCGRGDHSLLFPFSGDLYIVRLDADGPHTRRLTHDPDVPEEEPRCSPDGRSVAYVRGGNLWVKSLVDDSAPRALTDDATPTRTYGLAAFIAAEEFGRERGFWWSPDGRRLLVLRVDDSRVPLKTRAQIFADHTDFTQQRYPAAGDPNAVVEAMVLDAETGRRTPLPLPTGSEYVVRADWFDDGTPWLQTMTREQTVLRLTEFDPQSGAPHDITVERDPAWVETHDDLAELKGLSLSGRPALLWSTEASGRRQFVLVDRVTGARRALTAMPEPVDNLVCTDGQRVVFVGTADHGRARELYVLDLAGQVHPLAGAAPRQWRTAKGDKACAHLLVMRSAPGAPPRLELRTLADDAPPIAIAGEPPDPLVAATAPRAEPVDIRAADGITPLNAFWYAPAGTAAAAPGTHWPVIAMVYGGPGGQTVAWRWHRDDLLIAWWQRRGYGVFRVDNRGMAGRDREFTRAHRHAIGRVDVEDLFAAVRQLPARVPGIDPARIGVFGWSYGGYLAARAVLDADTPFAAAVAVAPVTDWALYDTAYTERYLGLPRLPDGSVSPLYRDASLLPRAGLLARPLLLMHGTADDNVLFENSLRLIEALEGQERLLDLAIYPGKAHGIGGRTAQLHLHRTMDAFFDRTLRSAAP
jgi:dipeptidyl-peptidase-4